MSKDLREMLDFASHFAELFFRDMGELFPMWHCVCADGNHFVSPSPSTDKDVASVLMRAMFELRDVVRYVYSAESWCADAQGEAAAALEAWAAEHGNVEHYPGRYEAIVFQAEDFRTGQITAERRIIRRTGKKPRLGPLKINVGVMQSEGRFVGMLPRRGMTMQ